MSLKIGSPFFVRGYVMFKTSQYYLFSIIFFIGLIIIGGIDNAKAGDNEDCPTYLREDFVATEDEDEKRKYLYSHYCYENQYNAPPSTLGPYDASEGNPGAWTEKPAFIKDSACNVDDPVQAPHWAMPYYLLPNDCVEKGIEFRNFYVTVGMDARREFGKDLVCTLNPVCAGNFTKNLGANDSYFHWQTMSEWRAEMEKDRLCVYITYIGFVGRTFLDCRKMPEPPSVRPPIQACWVAASCSSWDAIENQWFAPISSLVVQCVVDTVNGIFVHGRNACPENTETLFEMIQRKLKNTIRIVLILYIVFIGFKIMLGKIDSKKDIMEILFKLAFVLYFALGEGWKDYFLSVTGASADLARMALTGAVAQYGFCNFPNPSVPYDAGYEWMALWDTFDCKLFYYLGFRKDWYPKLLIVALANIFGFAFFIIFLTASFIVMFVRIMIYAVRMYVMVVLAIATLVYISPLLFPMLLFKPTASYFRKWLDELIGYVLYPMIMFAAIGLLITVFDYVYWGDAVMTNFDPSNGSLSIDCGGKNEDDPKVESMGCFMEDAAISELNLILFKVPLVLNFHSATVLLEVLKSCLFAYLFFKFFGSLGQFIGGITGTFRTAGQIAVPPPSEKELVEAGKMAGQVAAGGLAIGGMMAMGGEGRSGAEQGMKQAGDQMGGDKGQDQEGEGGGGSMANMMSNMSGDQGGGGQGGGQGGNMMSMGMDAMGGGQAGSGGMMGGEMAGGTQANSASQMGGGGMGMGMGQDTGNPMKDAAGGAANKLSPNAMNDIANRGTFQGNQESNNEEPK